MNKFIVTTLSLSLLSGCSSMFSSKADESGQTEPKATTRLKLQQPLTSSVNNKSVWQAQPKLRQNNNKNINDYAQGLMQELLANLQYVNEGTPIAVSDFVYLDGDFNTSDLLGKQLSQAFSHEAHKLGIPVVDYKLTGFIRVSPNGDFALSKDYLELNDDLPIRYILTGTLVEDRDSIIVNARIVGVESKAIVASAQGLIPSYVTKELSQNSADGLYY